MGSVLAIFVAAAFIILAMLALYLFIRRIQVGWRGFAQQGYEPIVDPYAPEAVAKSGAVYVVGVVAVAWALVHLLAVGYWAATGAGLESYGLRRTAAAFGLGGYIVLAASLTGIGGVMLARAMANGRKLIAWGQFLFAGMTLWSIAFSLRIPSHRGVPEELRSVGYYLAGILAGHLIIDTIIGTAAQRAGKAARPKKTPSLEDQQLLRQWDATQSGVGE